MNKFYSFLRTISNWMAYIGVVISLLLFMLHVIDVISTRFFNFPILGIDEITSFSQGLVVCLMAPLTHLMGRHVSIDLVTGRLSKTPQKVIKGVDLFIVAVLFAVMIFALFTYAHNMQVVGQYTVVLHLKLYPLIYFMAVSFIVPFIVVLIDSIKSFIEVRK